MSQKMESFTFRLEVLGRHVVVEKSQTRLLDPTVTSKPQAASRQEDESFGSYGKLGASTLSYLLPQICSFTASQGAAMKLKNYGQPLLYMNTDFARLHLSRVAITRIPAPILWNAGLIQSKLTQVSLLTTFLRIPGRIKHGVFSLLKYGQADC
jgi:hypothetical protein